MRTTMRKMVSVCLSVSVIVVLGRSHSYAESLSMESGCDPIERSEVSVEYSENNGMIMAAHDFLSDSKLKDYIDVEEFESNAFVARLEDEEDLNTYVFQNKDGTKTVYYLAEDVKYRDENGQLVEKDISLVSGDDGYYTADNNVSLFLPYQLSEGVQIGMGDYSISFAPLGINNSVARLSDNSVIYDRVFGEMIDIRYTPLLSGVKEDVLLNEYVPNASFSFEFDAGGLDLFESDGEYYFAENANSDTKIKLGRVYVYDNNLKPSMGEMHIEKMINDHYLITISADDAFLADPDTVYPVTIDPTYNYSGSNSGMKYIVDAPIFEGYPNSNFGGYLYNSIGTPDSTFKRGRTCIKTPALISYSPYSSITVGKIQKVRLYIKDASGNSSNYIHLYAMKNTTPAWTESTATWNLLNAYTLNTYDYGNAVGNAGWTGFNITRIVKEWKMGELSTSTGFMLVNSNESNLVSFFSSESTGSTNRPYISFTYFASEGYAPNEDGQNKNNWCWAACSKKVGEHNGGAGALPVGAYNLTYTDGLHSYAGYQFYGTNSSGGYTADAGQRTIVQTRNGYGNDSDTPGSDGDIRLALQQASYNTMTVGTKTNPRTTDLNFIKSELVSGRWLVASTYWDPNETGHAIVLTSYDANSHLFTVWNPWDDADYYITESGFVSVSFQLKGENVNRNVFSCSYCK